MRKPNENYSCIKIEIRNILGEKKIIEVKPYFDGKELSEIEFMTAERLLAEHKNKCIYKSF
jgi:hypothetical protein